MLTLEESPLFPGTPIPPYPYGPIGHKPTYKRVTGHHVFSVSLVIMNRAVWHIKRGTLSLWNK